MSDPAKKKAPELRFRRFEGEWEEKNFDNVFFLNNNKSLQINTSNYLDYGDFPIVDQGKTYISGYTNQRNTFKDTPCIVFGDHTRCLKWIDFEFCPGADGTQILKTRINNLFCYYLLSATAIPDMGYNRHLSFLKEKHFTTPIRLDEQQKIGHFFQQIDAQINHNQTHLDKLKQLKQAMLRKMFPQGDATEPEIRFKGFTGAWERVALGELAGFAKGKGYSKSDLRDTGSPVVLYGRLYTDYQTEISEVNTFALEKEGSLKSKGREVVVPASGETAGDIARASFVSQSGVLLGGDLNIVYPDSILEPYFLALSVSHGPAQKTLAKKGQGKSIVHIRNSDLKSLPIVYPDTLEQQKIGSYFRKLDELIAIERAQLEKLQQIKQACLRRMFA